MTWRLGESDGNAPSGEKAAISSKDRFNRMMSSTNGRNDCESTMGKASLDRTCDRVDSCCVWPQRDSNAARPNGDSCATDTDSSADGDHSATHANAHACATDADSGADGNHSATLSSRRYLYQSRLYNGVQSRWHCPYQKQVGRHLRCLHCNREPDCHAGRLCPVQRYSGHLHLDL